MGIRASRNDLAAGAMFVGFGAYFAFEALNYEFGTPFRMGPGFMPVVLGGILIALGLAVAAKAYGRDDAGEAPPWPWRGIVLVLGTIVFFAATIRGLGFIPVVAIAALLTALSSARNSLAAALLIAVGLCLLCYLIFVAGLGLIVPLFGPWLRF